MEIKVINTKIIRFSLRLVLIDFGCQQNLATPSNEDPNKQQSWYHCICLFSHPNDCSAIILRIHNASGFEFEVIDNLLLAFSSQCNNLKCLYHLQNHSCCFTF